MTVRSEIGELRRTEAGIERENMRLDRLQRDLSMQHPGHLVIFGFMPYGTWAELPAMWQSASELKLVPRPGLPPRNAKGAIAVSVEIAERLVG